ncbi:MAG: helix-turn-helix transcriptional regulator [Thermoleophilia bacterium]|nr:helix-turn-helix transcriptional regulator [Thermoleophilia bacterium]
MPGDDRRRPLFMISVAAELAEMHPQTLRMYERKGLIRPNRSSKQTRLYSMEDVDRLRRIQRLTSEAGLNLAGVEQVLELEGRLEQLRARVSELESEIDELVRQAAAQMEEVHRSYRKELVALPSREVVVRTTFRTRR